MHQFTCTQAPSPDTPACALHLQMLKNVQMDEIMMMILAFMGGPQ